MAVELAEVSLWLNAIHKDGHVPWFGYQLACGNSLVGARRQVYSAERIRDKWKDGRKRLKRHLWFNQAPRARHAGVRRTGADASAGNRVPLPAPRPRHGRLQEPAGEEAGPPPTSSGSRPGGGPSSRAFRTRTPPSWHGCRTRSTGSGRCTPTSWRETTRPPRILCRCGAVPIRQGRRPPTNGRTESERRASLSGGVGGTAKPLPTPQDGDGLLVRALVLAG